jgi:23S rRNA pseudouridine1911/1915/1917 synthase
MPLWRLLTLAPNQPILDHMEQQSIPIIYQDHHLLIVNKPAGLVVHPTYKHTDGTMWDALLAYLVNQGGDDWSPPDLPDEPGWERAPKEVCLMLREKRQAKLWEEEGLLPRPVLLHRLDKDTSGVVALARTARACRHIVHQFTEHQVGKRYLAVVCCGSPIWTRPRTLFTATRQHADGELEQLPLPLDFSRYKDVPLLLDGPLQRDPDDRRRCIVGADGQEASTQVTVLTEQGDFLLVEARPITGRTHQIRAHLAAAGYALVGDPTYASVPEPGRPEAALTRQFLHAFSLTLKDYPADHPHTFVAPLPPELVIWLTQYFPAGKDIPDARIADTSASEATE